MGERETQQRSPSGEESGSPPRAKPLFFTVKNIAVLLAAVGVSTAFAVFAVGNYMAPSIEERRASRQAQAETVGAEDDLESLQFFKIDPIIVNPANSNGERYLKAVVALETYEPKVSAELELRLPQIKNQINSILSSKTISQMQTNEDRERLRREIQNRVNGLLVRGRVSNVYFEEFVYQ
jgi:flagellar FliL protein